MLPPEKKDHILLINPWIYDFAAYDFWAKPLGLLYIAGLLRENGYRVHFFDCLNIYHPKMGELTGRKRPARRAYGSGPFYKENIAKPPILEEIPKKYSRYGITPEIFANDVRNMPPPAAILITSIMTYWYPGVISAIEIVKEIYPSIPVILGGIYATLCYDHAKRNSGADYIIKGEGEEAVLKLVNEITGKKLSHSVENKEKADFYPYPAFDLFPRRDYLCIMTSRGCPFKCSFCASSLLSPGFRQRDPCEVVNEILYWQKIYKIKDFAFYDDALLVNPERSLIPLLREIIKRKIACRFHSPNGLHIRELNKEIASLMFKGGFKTLRLGLETTIDERQKDTGGKVTNEEFVQAVANLKEAGFSPKNIGVYLLAGLPGQKAEEAEEDIRFVKEQGAKPALAEYSPIPGTALWEEAVKVSKFDLTKEPLFHNNSILPCGGKDFTRDDLNRLKRLAKA